MKTIRRSSILCLTLSAASLTACASLFGGEEVKVRPISNMSGLTSEPRDPLYESAVTAINERDYAKALDYLQEAKSKNPRNIKALNALGVVYDKLGRFDLSARYYAQAREIDPASRVVVANLDYSRALQGLMASNKQVVTLELPSNFNPDTASKPTVLASVPPTSVAATSQSVASSTVVSVPPAPVPTTLPTAATVRREPQVVQAELKQEPAPKRVVPAAVDFGGVVKNAMLRNANVTIQPMATPTARLPVERPVRATETSPLAVPVAAKTPAERNETNIVTLSSALVAPAAQALKPVASKPAAAEPAVPAVSSPQSRPAVSVVGSGKKVFFIGQPVRIMNASGKPDRVGMVSRRLSALGWTIRQADAARTQPITTLIYGTKNAGAAKAMQRTLPFPIRLVAENGAVGMRLVVGRDYLSWKSRNSRLHALWQKGPMIASLHKVSLKGVR